MGAAAFYTVSHLFPGTAQVPAHSPCLWITDHQNKSRSWEVKGRLWWRPFAPGTQGTQTSSPQHSRYHSTESITLSDNRKKKEKRRKKRKWCSYSRGRALYSLQDHKGEQPTQELARRCSQVQATERWLGAAVVLHPSRGCQRRTTKRGELCNPNPQAVSKLQCAGTLQT